MKKPWKKLLATWKQGKMVGLLSTVSLEGFDILGKIL
jgi:hypothetical protein